jgi:putative transposase
MLVLEFKAYGKTEQLKAIDEAIRICQFIRNKSIRLWMDGGAKSWFDLSKYCAIWAKEFDFANKLGAMARQASAERAWASISRFYDNVKKGMKGKKVGYPSFQTVDLLSTRLILGNSQRTASQSLSLINVVSAS